jgi:3D (Asp-Asp-Asp) domain-containing protein
MLGEFVFVVTAYATGCDTRPGALTKAGTVPVVGFTAAADPEVLPLGSIVHVEGLGERMVHDMGGAVKGRHVDVFMGSCDEARRWGRRLRQLRVVHVPPRRPESRSARPPGAVGGAARGER